MTEELFKVACKNYIKFYKENAKQDFLLRPKDLEDDEYVNKYFIKGKSIGSKKTAKFTYLQRKYYLTDKKVNFKESEKTFSVKLSEDFLNTLSSSEKEFISDNYLAIIAYISMYEITGDVYINELQNYVTSEDEITVKNNAKDKDPRIGKKVKTIKMCACKNVILTKNSIGIVKAIKGDKLVATFNEYLTKSKIDVEVSESSIKYIDEEQ